MEYYLPAKAPCFFIVLEIERKGYIIGFAESKDRASDTADYIFRLAYEYYEGDKRCNPFDQYRHYVIRNELFIPRMCVRHITDGICNTYVLEMYRFWKDVDAFVREREFQSKLFLDDEFIVV